MLLLPISLSAGAVDAVPNLNINASCKLEAESANSQRQCLADETQARDKLTQQWGQYPNSDRQQCTQTAKLGGTASYVELLTCLEMATAARNLPKQ